MREPLRGDGVQEDSPSHRLVPVAGSQLALIEGQKASPATDEGLPLVDPMPFAASVQSDYQLWRSGAADPKGDYINRMDCLIVGSLLVVTAASFVVGASTPKREQKEGTTPIWVLTLLASSYLLLVPGLMVTLFSFELQTVFGGRTLSITNGVQSEAMLPLAKLLFTTGSRIGGVLIIVYAAIVPGIKLVLLAVGELFRNSPDLRRVQTARICIQSVQFISKWACPDMFAYILLLYLFRDLDERSPLIQIPSHLEVGFSCFSLFCVCSTLATLALELPGEPRAAASGHEVPR